MMQGYDKDAAMNYLLLHVHQNDHRELSDKLPELLSLCIDLEMQYMEYAGVIDEEGYSGDGVYDEDDAIDYIVEGIIEDGYFTPEECVNIAALADDYLHKHTDYLEQAGLLSYDE